MHRALAIQDGFTEDVAVIIDREDPSPAAVLRTCSAQDTTLSLLKLCHPSFRVINGNVDDPLIAHNKQHDTWCQNAWMDSDSTPLDVKR
ncbi:MAG TPA: hypothetical protein VD927_05195, partial [Chryseosolibacter sp.]|nr:hypothetical protein [Chryseosolibacter sp.]